MIFASILDGHLISFDQPVQLLSNAVVNASVEVYERCIEEMLPTPAKSHYTYNLRDVSKVFQGMMMIEADVIGTTTDVTRLWVHECARVFSDRLVSQEDLTLYEDCIRETMGKHFKVLL